MFATGGDGFGAAFAPAGEALAAAGDAQAALTAVEWPEGGVLRVRMGVHTGEVDERGGDYFGPAVNRAARIMAAGHGGQVLVSAATVGVIGPAGLVDLGEHTFAGLGTPQRVYQAGEGRFAAAALGRRRPLEPASGALGVRGPGRGVGGGGWPGPLGPPGDPHRCGRGGQDPPGHPGGGRSGPEFPDGVWLVELAPLADAALVASTVTSALGVSVAGRLESAEAACRFLAQRRALVVLAQRRALVVLM